MHAVVLSKKGSKSDKNEDACLSFPTLGIFAVADGVGGGPSGDHASRAVVDTLYDAVRKSGCSHDNIVGAIEQANARIFQSAQRTDLRGMASTVVVGWKSDDQFVCFNVGDSRGYRIRANRIFRLTRDHVRQVQKAPNVVKQMVTNAVGARTDVRVEVTRDQVEAGDLFLLVSDGISDQLDDEAILAIAGASHLSLVEKARALIEASEARGGRDDKSVILALNE